MDINSKTYWDHRFDTNWIEYNGKIQTETFMNLLLQHLPSDISLESKDILDWGCALGQGVDVLSKRYSSSNVSGLDFSESAIIKCLDEYPMNDFFCGYLEDFNEKYDAIITSNCLEHFSDPFHWVERIMNHTNKYLIILVPYNDRSYENENSEHKYMFVEDSFPESLNGFNKVSQKVITECPNCWAGHQVLVVYEKE